MMIINAFLILLLSWRMAIAVVASSFSGSLDDSGLLTTQQDGETPVIVNKGTMMGMSDIGFDGDTQNDVVYQQDLQQKRQQSATDVSSSFLPYGVDVSFPIQHLNISSNYAYLPHNVHPEMYPIPTEYINMPISPFGEERWKTYQEYIKGCMRQQWTKKDQHDDDEEEDDDSSASSSSTTEQQQKNRKMAEQRCLENEQDRMEMALLQPRSMRNYTKMGFHKMRAPDHIYQLLRSYWERGQHLIKKEYWPKWDTYTNHWSTISKVLSIDSLRVSSTGKLFKQEMCDATESIISQWVQQKVKRSNVYGIRIYTTGAILATHVDRFPLVSSAIINVAQDVDEPWPLEVIGHDGLAYNITMEPGDMVLYESHSILHGRPFPLNGRYMANAFVHFEPIGPLDGSDDHVTTTSSDTSTITETDPEFSIEKGLDGLTKELPIYIIPGSPAEAQLLKMKKLQAEMEFRKEAEKDDDDNDDDEQDSHDVEMPMMTKMKVEDIDAMDDDEDDGEHDGVVGIAYDAAVEGSVTELEAEIRRDPTVVNALDDNGWTTLHAGIIGGHDDIVRLLIAHGANKDARTDHGTGGSALWWAKQVHGPDHRIVEYLESISALDIGPDF